MEDSGPLCPRVPCGPLRPARPSRAPGFPGGGEWGVGAARGWGSARRSRGAGRARRGAARPRPFGNELCMAFWRPCAPRLPSRGEGRGLGRRLFVSAAVPPAPAAAPRGPERRSRSAHQRPINPRPRGWPRVQGQPGRPNGKESKNPSKPVHSVRVSPEEQEVSPKSPPLSGALGEEREPSRRAWEELSSRRSGERKGPGAGRRSAPNRRLARGAEGHA